MYLPINSSYKDTAEHKHIYWNSHLTYMYVQTCCNALRSTLTWTMTGNNAKHAPKRRKRERSRNDIRGKNKSKIMKKKQTSADCSPTDLATWQQPDCLILNAEYTRPLDHSATLAWTFSLWEEGLWRTSSSVTPCGTDSYTSGTDLPGAFENAPWLQGWWTQYILLSEHCGPEPTACDKSSISEVEDEQRNGPRQQDFLRVIRFHCLFCVDEDNFLHDTLFSWCTLRCTQSNLYITEVRLDPLFLASACRLMSRSAQKCAARASFRRR